MLDILLPLRPRHPTTLRPRIRPRVHPRLGAGHNTRRPTQRLPNLPRRAAPTEPVFPHRGTGMVDGKLLADFLDLYRRRVGECAFHGCAGCERGRETVSGVRFRWMAPGLVGGSLGVGRVLQSRQIGGVVRVERDCRGDGIWPDAW